VKRKIGEEDLDVEQNLQLLQQKVDRLEQDIMTIKQEVKDLDKRVDDHDRLLGRVEVYIKTLSDKWSSLEKKIDQAINGSAEKNVDAWKTVLLEAIKTIGIVAGIIAAAKIFL
jgi:chromosome segregation ATPase